MSKTPLKAEVDRKYYYSRSYTFSVLLWAGYGLGGCYAGVTLEKIP